MAQIIRINRDNFSSTKNTCNRHFSYFVVTAEKWKKELYQFSFQGMTIKSTPRPNACEHRQRALHCSWQQIKVQPWFQIQCFAGSDRHIPFCHSLLPHSLVPQLAHVFSRSTTAQCNSATVLSLRSCTNWTYKLDSL